MDTAAPARPDIPGDRTPVRRVQMLGYASGNFGKNVLASTMDFFLLFILTERWGISPAAAGLVVMTGLVWDGVCDPLLGRLVDRSADRLGAYRRMLFVGAPVVGIFFAIFFLRPGAPGSLGQHAIMLWAITIVLLFRSAYSVCDVAHNALMMQLTRTPGAATTVSGLRYMFSCCGTLAVAYCAPAFVDPDRDGGHALAIVAGLAAVAYVVTLWLSAAAAPRSMAVSAHAQNGSFAWIVGNRPLLMLLALALAQALTLPVLARSVAYIGKGVIHDAGWTGHALATLALAQLVTLPGWMALARRRERRVVLRFALVAIAIGLGIFAAGPATMIAGIAVFGAGNAGLQMMIWILLADAVDHGERRTGVRLEGLPVALLLLTLKVGGGLSGALLGRGLSAIGWTVGQPLVQESRDLLLTMAWSIPLVGALAGLAIVLGSTPARLNRPAAIA
ncbi:MFS transporter [Sphingomonas sp. Leaf198]|uniref:MFS transporter n=1 Tax=Sphingomonas sp. Leaf198 TaxID=1736299 RepID=UPI0009EB5FA3|nr:MFS transporter [Sphingomonas sp. Leaf198]